MMFYEQTKIYILKKVSFNLNDFTNVKYVFVKYYTIIV